MKLNLVFIALALCLFSCRENSNNNFSKFLNPDALPTQIFELNINRDTILVTKGKCIIKIPAGSLQSDQRDVKLEIREALTNTDIILAGLTTMSGDKALSSGGMIKIDVAKGYKAEIKKPLQALIPTKNYNADMSVYKGVEKNGKIDWTDPEPLPNDSLQMKIKTGQALFLANCANCHKTDADFTGPAMKRITERRPLSWIYNFTRNPSKMISIDSYSQRLFEKFKPTVMTAFPQLMNRDIYDILAYVETKGGMRGADFVSSVAGQTACADSCEKYIQALYKVQDLQRNLDNSTPENFFTLNMTIPVPPQLKVTTPLTDAPFPVDDKKYVSPASVTATFYTVNINTFGWVNVDVPASQNKTEPSELFAKIEGNYETDVQVMLMIPSVKVFMQGGKSDDDKLYAFKETNGKIPLPQNTACTIIAFAESKGKLVFGKADFIATRTQTISISLSETTKSGLADQIKALKLDGIDTKVNDSEKSKKTKLTEQASEDAEKLKPRNCDCAITDSTTLP